MDVRRRDPRGALYKRACEDERRRLPVRHCLPPAPPFPAKSYRSKHLNLARDTITIRLDLTFGPNQDNVKFSDSSREQYARPASGRPSAEAPLGHREMNVAGNCRM